MVHFYNGDKTEAYLNLVDSEVIPEAEVEVVEPTDLYPTNFNSIQQRKTLCDGKTHVVRILKVTLGILLLLTIVILSYSVHVQNRNIQFLKAKKNIIFRDVNATSLCDRSNTFYNNLYKEKHIRKSENGAYCIDVCSHMKQISPFVNGITVLTDPMNDGCWCKNNVSVSTRYQSCFIRPDSTETVTPSPTPVSVDDTQYTCEFKLGAGSGGTEVKVGNLQGRACVKACLHFKQFDNLVNGVTVYSTPGKAGCWCEQRMRTVRKIPRFKTCFLKPRINSTEEKVDPNICSFSTGYGTGGTLMSMGKRSAKDCVEDCLHMKKIERRVNGVTMKSKDGSCWCDVAKTNISYSLKTCLLESGSKTCSFNLGNGIGGSVRKIGSQIGNACVSQCVHLRELNPFINGVTWYKDKKKSSCYCRSNMTHIDGIYKTCFLNPNITLTPLTTFHDYIPDCPLQPGDGSGVGEIYLGKLGREACKLACLHVKKIDDTINGMTVYANASRPGCWCEKGVRNVKKSKMFYSTCVFNFTHETREKINRHAISLCKFTHGYGAGKGEHVAHRLTRAYVGRLGADDCIEACAHLRRMDNSINGITRNTVTGRCSCDRNMASIGVKINCNDSGYDLVR